MYPRGSADGNRNKKKKTPGKDGAATGTRVRLPTPVRATSVLTRAAGVGFVRERRRARTRDGFSVPSRAPTARNDASAASKTAINGGGGGGGPHVRLYFDCSGQICEKISKIVRDWYRYSTVGACRTR